MHQGGHRPRWGGSPAVLLLLVGSAAVPGRALAQRAASPPALVPAALVFRGVTVIDVTDGRRQPDQTVVVVGTRIQTVGPTKHVAVPAGAWVVEAQGKYLLPGFWDMHTHAEAHGQQKGSETEQHHALYARYIANGITGIREMAQRWGNGEASDSFRTWQREIRAGTLVGPRAVGPSADVSFVRTPGGGESDLAVDDAPRVIDSLKAAGDAFIKYHNSYPDRDLFFAVLREARWVGLPVVGHVPRDVTNVQAADSGLRSIEHATSHHQCRRYYDPVLDSTALEAACAPVAQAYRRNDTWVTPTLSYHWFDSYPSPPDGRLCWECPRSPALWANTLRFWRTLHRLGVRTFLAGTDWGPAGSTHGGGGAEPGLSAREELVLLVNAGLTPLEALQAATLNPARFFNATDSLGTVAAGKLADLVLLDADPLVDIINVLELWGVVANGRYFDHATLVQMDPVGFTPGVGIVAADRRVKAGAGAGQPGSPTP